MVVVKILLICFIVVFIFCFAEGFIDNISGYISYKKHLKEKDEQEGNKYREQKATYMVLYHLLIDIREQSDITGNIKLWGFTDKIIGSAECIYNKSIVEENSGEIAKKYLKLLIDYYLPLCLKLLKSYNSEQCFNAKINIKKEIKKSIKLIRNVTNIMVNNLSADVSLDILTDIEVLKQRVVLDGFKSDFYKGE